MSRVRSNQKWVNENRYPAEVTNLKPITRMKGENPDPTKATTLSSWLFLKYDMSYKSYRNKSKARRDALREEFEQDTGRALALAEGQERELSDKWDEDWM